MRICRAFSFVLGFISFRRKEHYRKINAITANLFYPITQINVYRIYLRGTVIIFDIDNLYHVKLCCFILTLMKINIESIVLEICVNHIYLKI